MKIKVLLPLIVLLFLGCKQGNPFQKPYPEYEFKSLSGKTLKITKIKSSLEIQGQTCPILFYFIQPSCNTCFSGVEHIKRIVQDYGEKIDFIPILVSSQNHDFDKNEAMILNQTYHLDFDFYFSLDQNEFLQSFERQTDSNLLVLYDSKLKLVQTYEGIVPEEMIIFDLDKILKQMEKQ